jgi:DNA-binding NarL/FixJ family response regulator
MDILIADDHELYSLGIQAILNTKTDVKINSIDYCSNGKRVLTKLNGEKKYDFLITDLNMPELDGPELIQILHEKFPKLKIIVISMYCSFQLIELLKTYNVVGFIPKGINEADLIFNLNQILMGKTIFRTVNSKNLIVTDNHLTLTDHEFFIDKFEQKYNLTAREYEVALLMISDLDNIEISEKLFLSIETIKSYRKNIYNKTGVNSVLNLYKLLK